MLLDYLGICGREAELVPSSFLLVYTCGVHGRAWVWARSFSGSRVQDASAPRWDKAAPLYETELYPVEGKKQNSGLSLTENDLSSCEPSKCVHQRLQILLNLQSRLCRCPWFWGTGQSVDMVDKQGYGRWEKDEEVKNVWSQWQLIRLLLFVVECVG